jgi:hypothetical protein
MHLHIYAFQVVSQQLHCGDIPKLFFWCPFPTGFFDLFAKVGFIAFYPRAPSSVKLDLNAKRAAPLVRATLVSSCAATILHHISNKITLKTARYS